MVIEVMVILAFSPGKVVQESRSCSVAVTNDHQYISSSSLVVDVTVASSCGTRSHPWRLEAPLGQRISVSLLDFAGSASASRDHDAGCRQYGYVVERSNKKNVSMCAHVTAAGSVSQRESLVYESKTSSLDVVLVTGDIKAGSHKFLIKVYGMFYVIFKVSFC